MTLHFLQETARRLNMAIIGGSFPQMGPDGVYSACHLIGPDAGELIQLVGIAVKMRATKADFDATMAVHPTAAEELVTMREKAVTYRRQAAE